MSFLARTLDWFEERQSSHMGPDQYFAHAGERDGKPMSGDLLWAESEAETVTTSGNMVNAETRLLRRVAAEICDHVPTGTPLIELGPGTPKAFINKPLQIIRALASKLCTLVDDSFAVLQVIAKTHGIDEGLELRFVSDDFFETQQAYLDQDSLVCSFGSTVSNFPGPISEELPEKVLTNGLARMSLAAKSGWMLVGFDSDHNAERVKAFYKRQELFQLNIFFRM
jgi:uncharacterized SAM-dependent methyltransferase